MARFAPIANPNLGQRNRPRTSTETLRYYQERQPLLKNMSQVIGTTSAPSDQHQFAGTTPDGYAIWKKAEPAPAPSGGGGGGGGGSAPAPAAQLQISDEAKAYRAESERILKEAQDLRAKFAKEEEQAKAARELQQKLFIEAQQGVASQIQKEREAFQSAEAQRQANIEAEFQRTKAYDLEKAQAERARQQNIARAARSANVGIAPAGSAEPGGTTVQRPTGTQAFKRRPLQIKPTAYSALAIGNTANLNV